MLTFHRIAAACVLMSLCTAVYPQADEGARSRDGEALKIAALEALMSAPPERALPIAGKVLKGGGSEALKERALFVLSQIDLPEARSLLVETARTGEGDLRDEAIRMIGISGDPQALGGLSELYAGGDRETKEAVLEAYLIANDTDAVYRIAVDAQDAEEFDAAVEALGAMGATEQLRALRSRTDMSESLIEAYAMTGDTESLREMAMDGSDPERQAEAIEGLGMVGGPEVGGILVGIYGSTDSPVVREAVVDGLMMSGDDEAVLQLFRASGNDAEKAQLLEVLVMMGSDAAWDVIDATLENGE